MSLYEDYVNFIDAGCPVPYNMDGAKYVMKPDTIDESFDYDFKIYFRSGHDYYVGLAVSRFVRPIHASDYKLMLSLAKSREEAFLDVKKKQLVMDFS